MKLEIPFGLDSAAWPAVLASASGAVLRANTAAISLFGAALDGDAPQLSAIWPPENGGTPEQFITNWERSPQATVALKFRVKGGESKSFSISLCSFTHAGQKYFILQALPESEAPDAGLANRQKLDCALQLARTVSLDFNNALTTILGHVSFLLGKAEAGHPWRHSLMEVEKSAARAAEIANELATFSQHEKETRLQPPGNLNAVAQRCVEFFRNSHGAKIAWKTQLERELFGSRFDEAKMQQALTKILENAVESLTGGDGQIIVQTRNVILTEPTQDRTVHLAAGTYVSVEIADNGGGIGPEVLPRIFEPFFTTKRPPHRGLGLALVYGIVTNHGGGVAISSQLGAGTSARIYLPAEKQLVRENDGVDDNLHGTATVLVVDDENLLLTMSEMILTDYGYRVLTAASGQKALAVLSRDDTKVDLVVTDLVMPGMGGRELVERIRQLAPGTRILCTSGYALPADKQTTGTTYLQKPFTSAELLTKVKRALISETSVD